MRFWCHFGSFWVASGASFWPLLPSKTAKSGLKRVLEAHLVENHENPFYSSPLAWNCVPGAQGDTQDGPRSPRGASKRVSEGDFFALTIWLHFCLLFGAIFGRFWLPLGTQLGAKILPKSVLKSIGPRKEGLGSPKRPK